MGKIPHWKLNVDCSQQISFYYVIYKHELVCLIKANEKGNWGNLKNSLSVIIFLSVNNLHSRFPRLGWMMNLYKMFLPFTALRPFKWYLNIPAAFKCRFVSIAFEQKGLSQNITSKFQAKVNKRERNSLKTPKMNHSSTDPSLWKFCMSKHLNSQQETLCVVVTIAMICSTLASLWKSQYFQRPIYNPVEDLWWSLYCRNIKPLSIFTKKLPRRCSHGF